MLGGIGVIFSAIFEGDEESYITRRKKTLADLTHTKKKLGKHRGYMYERKSIE